MLPVATVLTQKAVRHVLAALHDILWNPAGMYASRGWYYPYRS